MPRFSWECPQDPVALWKPSPLQWCASGSFSISNMSVVPVYAYKGQNLYANPWINEVMQSCMIFRKLNGKIALPKNTEMIVRNL